MANNTKEVTASTLELVAEIEGALKWYLAVFLIAVADELISRDGLRTREGRTIRTLEEWVRLVLKGEWP